MIVSITPYSCVKLYFSLYINIPNKTNMILDKDFMIVTEVVESDEESIFMIKIVDVIVKNEISNILRI